jgi:urease accessory protein
MSDWLAWQVIDSAFPTGGFVHSFGLEAAWQHGEVVGVDGLRRFLKASIRQAGHATLPLLNEGYRRPEDVAALDQLADVFLVNVVANRASRVQGRTLVATVGRVWPSHEMESLRRSAAAFSHVAPVSGVTFRVLGLPLPTAQRMALYSVSRGVLTAAVRLGIVGSYEAQVLQHAAAPWMEQVASQCGEFDIDDLAQTAPVIDILQGCHDRLYSRLFQS